MSTRIESVGGMPDIAKYVVAVLLVIAGLAGFYFFADESLLLRVVALLALLGGAVAVASQTVKGREVVDFVREARVELRKVVWPTRQETTQTTLVVLAVVFIVAIMLWILDSILSMLVRMLLNF